MGSDQNKWGLKFMTTNNQTSIASLAKNKEHTVLNLNSRSIQIILWGSVEAYNINIKLLS